MGGRTYAGLAQPESPFGQGLRGDSGKRDDVAVHCQCKIDVPAPGKNSGQVTVTGKIVSQNSGLQRCRGDSSQTLMAVLVRLGASSSNICSLINADFAAAEGNKSPSLTNGCALGYSANLSR